TLSAATPAYFRGFTLIALKEGKEGDKEEDHAGTFQELVLIASGQLTIKLIKIEKKQSKLIKLEEENESKRTAQDSGNRAVYYQQYQIIDEEETQFMSNCPVAVTESTPRRRTRIQIVIFNILKSFSISRDHFKKEGTNKGRRRKKKNTCKGDKIKNTNDNNKITGMFQRDYTCYACLELGKQRQGKGKRRGKTGEERKDFAMEGVTDKPIIDCCACGTAKYRLTFYGNWSEKSHPKDYP
ncbi:hypothetical protein L345_10818, partial [Ophiophagus hannah]